jgi:hypothetical protein
MRYLPKTSRRFAAKFITSIATLLLAVPANATPSVVVEGVDSSTRRQAIVAELEARGVVFEKAPSETSARIAVDADGTVRLFLPRRDNAVPEEPDVFSAADDDATVARRVAEALRMAPEEPTAPRPPPLPIPATPTPPEKVPNVEPPSDPHTRWGVSAGASGIVSSRGPSGGLDVMLRYRYVEGGIRAELGASQQAGGSLFGLLGAVAGVRIPLASGRATALSLHVLGEAGADLTLGTSIGTLLFAPAPGAEYRGDALVPYVGLRAGAEWRIGAKWPVGPTLGLWTFARTDTTGERLQVSPFFSGNGNSGSPSTMLVGGQSDIGLSLRVGIEFGR